MPESLNCPSCKSCKHSLSSAVNLGESLQVSQRQFNCSIARVAYLGRINTLPETGESFFHIARKTVSHIPELLAVYYFNVFDCLEQRDGRHMTCRIRNAFQFNSAGFFESLDTSLCNCLGDIRTEGIRNAYPCSFCK